MKKRFLAASMAVVLSLSMSFTSLAINMSDSTREDIIDETDSSGDENTDTGNVSNSRTSGTQEMTVAAAAPGGRVAPSTVSVAIANADGTVSVVSLATVISDVRNTLKTSTTTSGAASTLQALMTTVPTGFFARTFEALVESKGSAMAVNDCGTVKTAAIVPDPLGNNIASAGVIPHVTTGALVMLMSVDADGTIEYVEGVVDPVTGAVLGAFKGVPVTLTVLVLA